MARSCTTRTPSPRARPPAAALRLCPAGATLARGRVRSASGGCALPANRGGLPPAGRTGNR
jgi:hypothetical protein